VRIARQVPYPVKLVWSREDDTRGGQYRPMALHRLFGRVGAAGEPESWLHRIVGQSVIAHSVGDFLGARAPASMPRQLRRAALRGTRRLIEHEVVADFTSTEGAADLPYAIPNLRVELATVETGVPIGWWRAVGHTHTAFAVECFLDELAHAGGRDPCELRLALLGNAPRLRRTLEIARQKSGWGGPRPAGTGLGVAAHESFKSYCSQVVEVEVDGGSIRVKKVVAVIDCGRVINPDIVRAQIEGGIVFGLSAALHQEITFERGRVAQSNFHDFPLLRMHECPEIEVHIVPSDAEPTGVGEPGLPPVAPALGNAIFAATGLRIRKLPAAPELARLVAKKGDS
jgi:isoquinoline 1-oxidoreductase subunit beta